MRNHDKGLSLTEFVLRQYLIGGTNTFGVLAADPIDDWKMPRAFECPSHYKTSITTLTIHPKVFVPCMMIG